MLPSPEVLQELTELTRIIRYADCRAAITRIEDILHAYKQQRAVYSHALYLRAWVHWALNEYPVALRTIKQSLNRAHIDDEHYFAARLKQADIETSLGNSSKALTIWLDILSQAQPNRHEGIFAECYMGIGSFFQMLNDAQRSEAYYQYAFESAKNTADPELTIKTAIFLLSILCQQHKNLVALTILEHCWPLIEQGQFDPAHIASLYHYAGLALFGSSQLTQATDALKQSLVINETHFLLWGQTQNRMILAQVLAAQGEFKQAIALLEGAILIASGFDLGPLQQQICELIRDIHRQNGNFAAALGAQERVHHLSVFNRLNLRRNLVKISPNKFQSLDKHLKMIQSHLVELKLRTRIAELEARLDQQQRQPMRDALTQLPNQLALSEDYFSNPSDFSGAYLTIELLNLPQIEQQLGQEIGEQLIRAVVEALDTVTSSSLGLYQLLRSQWLCALNSEQTSELIASLNQRLPRLAKELATDISLAIKPTQLEVDRTGALLPVQSDSMLWQYPPQEGVRC